MLLYFITVISIYPIISRCKFFNSPIASGRLVSRLSCTCVNRSFRVAYMTKQPLVTVSDQFQDRLYRMHLSYITKIQIVTNW